MYDVESSTGRLGVPTPTTKTSRLEEINVQINHVTERVEKLTQRARNSADYLIGETPAVDQTVEELLPVSGGVVGRLETSVRALDAKLGELGAEILRLSGADVVV